MKKILFCCLMLLLFASCKKERYHRVDIYQLKSFTTKVNLSPTPVTISITNAVMEDTPLVADNEIMYYTQASHTFVLNTDLKSVIQNYGPDKAFAVTVDHQPVYYGKFVPLYVNSIYVGVATANPFLFKDNELRIDFPSIEGDAYLQHLDNRDDSRIIKALKATKRLR